MNKYVEITQEAFKALVGNNQPEESWFADDDLERSIYKAKGLHIEIQIDRSILPCLTQYYILDIINK